MAAARRGQTEIIGAGVVVVAVGSGPANTVPPTAFVVGRTRIPVVAVVGVVGRFASRGRIAGIVGAHVVVVAQKRRAPRATSSRTRIIGGTGIAIAA